MKLKLYEDSGFNVGEDIIYSMESEEYPLNVKQLEHKIKKYFL